MAAASSARAGRAPAHHPQDLEGGDDPVARGRVLEDDHVAALLAAEPGARDLHALEDVLVADRRADDLPAGRLDGLLQPAVREHRHDERAARQLPAREPVEGQDAEDLVAVDDPARRVDRDEPVGVAIEREADVGARRDDGLGERRRERSPRSRR